MKTKSKQILQNKKMQAFLINLVIGFFSFIWIILRNNGLFTLCDDFNNQTIPLSMVIHDAIKTGNIFWNWNIDMGSSFVGSTSFNVLGDPFFYLTLPFPKNLFPYLTGWLQMIKYAVAGWLAYCYMERYFEKKEYVIIGSILYAFSGFQATNLMFQFNSSAALFPLLLIAIDKLVLDGKKGYLASAVCISAWTDFYIFTAEVIFCIIYFLIRFFTENKQYYKKIMRCILEGILGIGMAMVIYLPSIVFSLLNPRSSVLMPMERWFEFDRRGFLYTLRTFLLPAEIMCKRSFVYNSDYSSKAAYLPMIGLALVLCYVIKKRKSWLTKLIVIMAIFCLVPILNSSFFLFSESNYNRWYFMLVLMLGMASALVLEKRAEFPVVKTVGIYLIGIIVFFGGSIWWDKQKFQLIYDQRGFYGLFFVAIVGCILTILFAGFCKEEKTRYLSFIITVALFAAFTTAQICDSYQEYALNSEESGNGKPEDYYDKILKFQQITDLEEAYRVNSSDNTLNMTVPFAGSGSFLSTVNGSVFEFYEALNKERKCFTPELDAGTRQLLSSKYYISKEQKKDELIQMIDTISGTYYLYAYAETLPIGFTYDTYITKREFDQCEDIDKSMIMLKTLVVPDKMADEISKKISHYDLTQRGIPTEEEVSTIVKEHEERASNFNRDSMGFTCNLKTNQDKYAFFSVPNDFGWNAKVNGTEVEIVNINGLMAIPVAAGNNEIEFTYVDLPMVLGGVITILSVLVWIFYRKKVTKREMD